MVCFDVVIVVVMVLLMIDIIVVQFVCMLCFLCLQFVVECIDLLVFLGMVYIFYMYQIVGGDLFQFDMFEFYNFVGLFCILCFYIQDKFNYWIVVMYF